MLISLIKKKAFPKKLLIATLSGVALVFSIYFYEMYFFTFNEIDRAAAQEGAGPVISPTEKYTAIAYYEPYGGAAGGVNVWVEIINLKEANDVQVVYYADARTEVHLFWVDGDTLNISNRDRSIKLEIGKEIYHDTGLACKSLLIKDQYETCYQK